MALRPGLRLESATCDTQVVVVMAPRDGGGVDLCCGGEPMRVHGTGGGRVPISLEGDVTRLGTRYVDEDLGMEVLCSRGGDGALSIGDRPLLVKGAKPLPSSD